MLSLQSRLKEAYSPQFSMSVFSSGKSFEPTLAPPEYSLPLHSFVPVNDGDRVEQVDRSSNPNPNQSERMDRPMVSEGGNEVEGSDGVRNEDCGKENGCDQELNKERLVNGDKKVFECTEPGCELKFQTSSGLYKHRKKHQGGVETFICPEEGCGLRYQTKYVLMNGGVDE